MQVVKDAWWIPRQKLSQYPAEDVGAIGTCHILSLATEISHQHRYIRLPQLDGILHEFDRLRLA